MNWKRNTPTGNALWLMAGRCLQLGLQLVTGLWVARYLGPEDFGLLSYAGACTGLLASLCQLGFSATLVKEFQDAPDREGEILGTALGLRFLSSLACAGVLLLAVRLSWAPELVALAAVGMVFQMFDSLQCWFQWRQRSWVTAGAMFLGCAAGSGWKLLLLVSGKDVTWFALGTAVDLAVAGMVFLAVYRRQGGRRLRFSRSLGLGLLSRSCHFILPGLMAAVYAQVDKILLGLLAGEAQVGLYATSVSLSSAWGFVLSAIIEAAYPGIAAYSQDKALFSRKNRRLYGLIFYLSGAVSLGITLLARPAIGLLYGPDYRGAVLPLQILTWSTGFSYLGVARNVWVVCKNVQKHLIWVYAAGAAISLGLNLLLIPLWGAAGAALSALTAQMLTAVAVPFAIPSLRENGKWMLWAILPHIRQEETP